MGGIHALIGTGEGLITVGALAFLHASRRDLLRAEAGDPKRGRLVWVAGLALALLLAVASPLASKHPDGLMRVATQFGFLGSEHNPIYELIPHYLFPGVSNPALATILAAVLGTLIVFGVALGVAFARRRKPSPDGEQNDMTPAK
jgi:cobalt/nickel transport system permease protein